jgi:hypothetical protein
MNANKAIEFLLARGNLPILFWLKKDILEVPIDREYKNLQKFAARIRILNSQKSNGAWSKKKIDSHPRWEKTYYIVDTLRNVFLLYNYGCEKSDEGVQKAIKFIFTTQTEEGDFRGAYLNEYAPTYHALSLEILCLFGLGEDKRVQAGFKWLTSNRQADGGWVIPYRTIDEQVLKKRYNFEAQLKLKPVKPDKKQPFSHLVTGMVLRAFAASPQWQKSKTAHQAGELLASRFFKPDLYNDRREAFYWEELTYPFWAVDILSALDSLSKLGFTLEDENIQKAFQWLISRQNKNGYWEAGFKKSTLEDHLWITLSMLRIIKQFGLLSL